MSAIIKPPRKKRRLLKDKSTHHLFWNVNPTARGTTAPIALTPITPKSDDDIDIDVTESPTHDHNNATSASSNTSTLMTKQENGRS